jgi:uroporphyrinogen-III decarboxylase
MSPEQYEKFYWPGLKRLTLALVDAGLTPILFFQGDYSSRLRYLIELPPGKVPLHFDQIDRQKAFETIGGKQCFWGNIPASLLVTGTPQDVKEDIKQLIDLFGDTGGLIIDCASGIPDEAKPENVAAMVEATLELG